MSPQTIVRSAATWLRGALLGLVGAAAVMAVAVIVVWPLWYMATAHTSVYTVLVLASAVGIAVYWLATRHRRRRNSR